jgi:hypothetical protein
MYRHTYIHVGCVFPGDGYRSYGDNYVAYISMRSISITQLRADEKLFTDCALLSILKYSLCWKDLKFLDITDNVSIPNFRDNECLLKSTFRETKLILMKIEEFLTRLIIISGEKRFEQFTYQYRSLEANPNPNHGINEIPWISINNMLFNRSDNKHLSIGVRHPLLLKDVLLNDRQRLMNN